jgi:hypothetical protein
LVYYFILNNVFHKIKDNKAFEYKNVSLGKITTVDIKTFKDTTVLRNQYRHSSDNQLNEVQKINFSENGGSLVVSGIGIAKTNSWFTTT